MDGCPRRERERVGERERERERERESERENKKNESERERERESEKESDPPQKSLVEKDRRAYVDAANLCDIGPNVTLMELDKEGEEVLLRC